MYHTLSLWAWHFKNHDLWEIPKIWKITQQTSCQEDVHCLVWQYNSKLQPHQYHQWSSPWSSWFKSYPIYVHRTPALLFCRLKRVRIPFLVVQPLFHEVFLDHGWRLAQEKRISWVVKWFDCLMTTVIYVFEMGWKHQLGYHAYHAFRR